MFVWPSVQSFFTFFHRSVAAVLITFVKQLSLTAAERCRPQFRDLTSDMEATYSQWMGSLAGVVATRPAGDVEKAAAIFEQYNEPFLKFKSRCLATRSRGSKNGLALVQTQRTASVATKK